MVFLNSSRGSPKITVCKSHQASLCIEFKKSMSVEEKEKKEFLASIAAKVKEKIRLEEEKKRQEVERKRQEDERRYQESVRTLEEKRRLDCERFPIMAEHIRFFEENSHLNGIPGGTVAYIPFHDKVITHTSYDRRSRTSLPSPKNCIRTITLNPEAIVNKDDIVSHNVAVLFEYEKCVGLIDTKTFKNLDGSEITVNRFFLPTSFPDQTWFPVFLRVHHTYKEKDASYIRFSDNYFFTKSFTIHGTCTTEKEKKKWHNGKVSYL